MGDPAPPRRKKTAQRYGTAPAMGAVQAAAVPVAPQHLELFVEKEAGSASTRSMRIESDYARIGSHESNDLVLADEQVSRFHCALRRDHSTWRVEDSGSLNGTRLNDLAVRDADLPSGACVLEIGGSRIKIRPVAPANRASIPPPATAFGSLHGNSASMRRVFRLIEQVAKTESNVLVEGESGTGKELVATEIVRRGPRADKPLIILDCGALSPNIIGSTLFGHCRGAFTGADRDSEGVFEAADGGTVFLDEIGEMPLDLQPKLLRTIQSRAVCRLGETKQRPIDVRIIAATNRRLEREVNHGRFREDLYFRLAVVVVRIPPLRERREDIGLLVDAILRSLDASESALFTPEVLARMVGDEWPGNIRELRNYVERALVMEEVRPVVNDPATVPPAAGADDPLAVDLAVPLKAAKERLVARFESQYITALLAWSEGNVSRAARRANMDRINLHRLIQRYGLAGPRSLED